MWWCGFWGSLVLGLVIQAIYAAVLTLTLVRRYKRHARGAYDQGYEDGMAWAGVAARAFVARKAQAYSRAISKLSTEERQEFIRLWKDEEAEPPN